MSTMTPAQLTTWIEDLRDRLERGELDSNTTAGAEATYLVLLVDSWRAATPDERMEPAALAQQRQLAEQLSALHAHLVDGKPQPRSSEDFR